MNSHQPRRGFTLTDLLMVVAVLIVIAGLLLPAVQSSREAADATGCKNNLRYLGLGVLNHNDQRGDMLPMGMFSEGVSWSGLILPYMEQMNQWHALRFDQPYDSETNARVIGKDAAFPYLLCPSRRRPPQFTNGLAAADYAVPSAGVNPVLDDLKQHDTWMECHSLEKNRGLMLLVYAERPEDWPNEESLDKARRYRSQTSFASARDGLTYHMFFGEKALHKDGLNKLEKAGDFTTYAFVENSFNASGPARPNNGGICAADETDSEAMYRYWGSWHPGVCQISMGDGRVRALNIAASDKVLALLGDRQDGSKLALPETSDEPFDDKAIVSEGVKEEPATTPDDTTTPKEAPSSTPPAPDTRGFEEKFAAEKRTWSDKTGTYQVEAVYAGFEPGAVLLQKVDMATVKVKLADLSEVDRRYAVAEARKRGDLD